MNEAFKCFIKFFFRKAQILPDFLYWLMTAVFSGTLRQGNLLLKIKIYSKPTCSISLFMSSL